MPDRATIWIANDAGHPTHKALDLVPGAEIRALTLGDINPLYLDRVAYHVARGITHYTSPDDYLIMSGYQVVSAMVFHFWLTHHGRIRLLLWNPRRQLYTLSEKTNEDFVDLLQREMERP